MNEISDRELRLSALSMAARVCQRRGEPYTVADVRAAAQRFYEFLADAQSEAQRLGLPPTPADTVPTRLMTPEEFRHVSPVKAWNAP